MQGTCRFCQHALPCILLEGVPCVLVLFNAVV